MAVNSRHNLNRLAYFVAIVEEKTITAASKRLGLSKAVVSKQLQSLEEEVGISLVVRNTRHMHTTKAGDTFYIHSKEALKHAQRAFEELAEVGREPAGLIRITSPIDFGVFQLSSFVAKFCRMYPKIDIELNMSDEIVDIVSQRYDLSFRIGWLNDSSNRARKIGSFREVAVCSADAARIWEPSTPQDLQRLPFVAYHDIDRAARVFTRQKMGDKAKLRTEVQLKSNLTFNVTSALREALFTGQYFGILPNFTVQNDLDSGKLAELLSDWQLREGGIYVVSPPSKLRTQAIQLFISSLLDEFSC